VRSTRRQLRLSDITHAVGPIATDFVLGRGRRARYIPSISANADLTVPITPGNIEAIARKYFDKSPDGSRLGVRATSDYANYYGAWAIGVIAPSHHSSAPDQPMRIDLASLGLIRRIMEENGIDLHGLRQQAYVDASTQPPTSGLFHHSVGTFCYVPPSPIPLNRQVADVIRLASLGFPKPPTTAIRLPTGKQLPDCSHPAKAVRNARFVRARQSNSVS